MPFSKETPADMPNHESYDLYHDSPRSSSIESNELKHTTHSNASPVSSPTITPSICLLFYFISRHHLLILLLPAIFASIIASRPFHDLCRRSGVRRIRQLSNHSQPPHKHPKMSCFVMLVSQLFNSSDLQLGHSRLAV